MGQRTLIICKRNFADGTTKTVFQYHQWGIGKMMTTQFMQEFLAVTYPIIPLGYGENKKTLKDFFNFNNEKEELKTIVTENIDIWNKAEILPIIEKYGLNNGAMLCEVTEKHEEYSSSINLSDVKIGFLLDYEETNNLKEQPYTRFVSAKEYQILTGGYYCDREWIECFDKFLTTFEIDQVVDEIEPTVQECINHHMYQWEHGLYNVTVMLDTKKLDEKALKRYKMLDSKKVSAEYGVDKDGTIKIRELDLRVPIYAIDLKKSNNIFELRKNKKDE